MKLLYESTPEDVFAFNMYHIGNSQALSRIRWSQVACILLLSFILFAYSSWAEQTWTPLLVWAMTSPLLAFITLWLYWAQIRRNLRKLIAEGKNHGLFGPKVLEVVNGQVIERSRGRMSGIDIDYLERIVVTPAYLFIYHTAVSAFVVPRAFVSDDELNDFLDALREEGPDLTERPATPSGITEFVKGQGR